MRSAKQCIVMQRNGVFARLLPLVFQYRLYYVHAQ